MRMWAKLALNLSNKFSFIYFITYCNATSASNAVANIKRLKFILVSKSIQFYLTK
jgi:hypothetical protein